MAHRRFVVTWLVVSVAAVLLSILWLPRSFFANSIAVTNLDGATLALELLKDWTVWMASIQTATIAGLGLLAKDGLSSFKPGQRITKLALLVVLFNTGALVFSAWLLTALPSVALRTYTRTNVDFYNYTLYAFMEKYAFLDALTVGFFAFWNHWLWAIGCFLAGSLAMAVFAKRNEA